MNLFFAAMPFVALAFLVRQHLHLNRPRVTPERYDLRTPSFCPRCQRAITDQDVNRLHGELGAWRGFLSDPLAGWAGEDPLKTAPDSVIELLSTQRDPRAWARQWQAALASTDGGAA